MIRRDFIKYVGGLLASLTFPSFLLAQETNISYLSPLFQTLPWDGDDGSRMACYLCKRFDKNPKNRVFKFLNKTQYNELKNNPTVVIVNDWEHWTHYTDSVFFTLEDMKNGKLTEFQAKSVGFA